MLNHRLTHFIGAVTLTCAAVVSGCASNPTWIKAGATEADLSRDRLSCMKESQITHEGNYKMNSEGQFSSQHYNIDSRLFNICMGDAGWTRK